LSVVEAVFVDTNVLIYASRPTSEFHTLARAGLDQMRLARCPLWISGQILREYLAAVTRPQSTATALPVAAAIADVQTFRAAFNVAEDRPEILDRLLILLKTVPTAGRQVHDANIVATMLTHGVTRLLTFNAADFRRFTPAIELVPIAG